MPDLPKKGQVEAAIFWCSVVLHGRKREARAKRECCAGSWSRLPLQRVSSGRPR